MLFNINRGRDQAARSSDHYMPFKPRRQELSDEEVEAQIEAFFGGH